MEEQQMDRNYALMVFVKNAEKGNVKTRLARTIGDDKALQVYQLLLKHTLDSSVPVSADKWVCYSDRIPPSDAWKENGFRQLVQKGPGLGERMTAAFATAFGAGYQKAVLIGSDCPELTNELLESAFYALDRHDVVIGPACDGGYYLVGMKKLHTGLFEGKTWSTSNVLQATISDLNRQGLTYFLLPELSDIDEEQDLNKFPSILLQLHSGDV